MACENSLANSKHHCYVKSTKLSLQLAKITKYQEPPRIFSKKSIITSQYNYTKPSHEYILENNISV